MVIVRGQYNEIPEGTFAPFRGDDCGPIIIGDCNTIHAGVRILVGPGGFKMGDWNTVHNRCTIIGPGAFSMGHNCWFGQECYLDTTGGLAIGNGVTLGVRTAIWTHVARGEQIEGWVYNVEGAVTLKDDVWLMGNGVHIAPGVTMEKKSVALANAAVTHDTVPDSVYAGVPAVRVDVNLRTYKNPSEKMELMLGWVREFCINKNYPFDIQEGIISFNDGRFCVSIFKGAMPGFGGATSTYFSLSTRTYTKKLTPLEREFIGFLKANRARFIPE